jgi:hypothetical protein
MAHAQLNFRRRTRGVSPFRRPRMAECMTHEKMEVPFALARGADTRSGRWTSRLPVV